MAYVAELQAVSFEGPDTTMLTVPGEQGSCHLPHPEERHGAAVYRAVPINARFTHRF